MGLREQINEKPGLAAGAVVATIVALGVFIGWQIWGGRPPTSLSSMKIYFTADDGHTWFADDSTNIPPYDHDGAQAVRCFVFKCSSSAPFVGYMESLTQQAHDQLTGVAHEPPGTSFGGTLVKKPGDKNWVLSYSAQGAKIMAVRCPDGSAEKPQPVLP